MRIKDYSGHDSYEVISCVFSFSSYYKLAHAHKTQMTMIRIRF